MAFTFGFYNSVNHDRTYDAIQMSSIFDGIITDGVYATWEKGLIVKSSTNLNTVIVQPGRAWFNHTWNYNDSDLLLQLPPPEFLKNRIDAVILDINSDTDMGNPDGRTNAIKFIQGDPHNTSPEPPTMIHTLTHHQYPLAYVYRRPNIETINQADITNTIGTDECPIVTGALVTISIEDLIMQWRDQWAQFVKDYEDEATEWTEAQKEDFITFYTEFKVQMEAFENASGTEFNTWFANLKEVLSTNAAGNLLNLINEANEREFNRYYGLIESSTIISKDENNGTIITTETSEAVSTTTFENVDVGKKIITFLEPVDGPWNYRKVTTIDKITDNSKTIITTEYEKIGKI